MKILSIVLILVFDVVLCITLIPKLYKNKLYKDLWTFIVLLGLGTVLALLKSMDMNIPNPSDWVMTVYAPVSELLKNVFE